MQGSWDLPNNPGSIQTIVTRGFSVKWIDCSGGCSTLATFLDEIRGKLQHLGFPKNFFRLFLDNSPAPIATTDNMATLGLLLRLPQIVQSSAGGDSDLREVETVRFVVLLAVDEGLIFTYLLEEDALVAQFRGVWESNNFRFADIGALFEAITRRALRRCEETLRWLNEELTAADAQSEDEVLCVQRCVCVRKYAEVARRCLSSSLEVLQQAAELEHCEQLRPNLKTLCNQMLTFQTQCDEIFRYSWVNAKKHIAFTDFRTNVNFSIFQELKIFSLPITIATSWYGMNFESMHELTDPDGYKIFCVVVLSASLLLLAVVRMHRYLLNRQLDSVVRDS
jgi:Mg2+ and Co2+ transporter CorA